MTECYAWEIKRAIYVLSNAASVPNGQALVRENSQAVSIIVLMQMQAIKQNSGKQCNASDMQGKTKAGTENGANASGMQKKTGAGMQNDANASDMQRQLSGHAKRCMQCK